MYNKNSNKLFASVASIPPDFISAALKGIQVNNFIYYFRKKFEVEIRELTDRFKSGPKLYVRIIF